MSKSEYYKKRRQERKSKGLCPTCGRSNESKMWACESCRIKVRENALKNKERRNSSARGRVKENYEMLAKIKSKSGCVDCGFNEHFIALQFDHLPQFEKIDHVSKLACKSKKLMLEEVEKCEVVCANCHAIRTFKRKNNLL